MPATQTAAALPTHSTYKVDAMLSLDGCLDYQVKCNQAEAECFLSQCEVYNDHDNADLIRLITTIDATVPRRQYNPGNPNNGLRAHDWKIGNESSRVVYLTICTYSGAYNGIDLDALVASLCTIAKGCNADEAWEVERRDGRSLTLRFWFD
jgi:hypothetical protein